MIGKLKTLRSSHRRGAVALDAARSLGREEAAVDSPAQGSARDRPHAVCLITAAIIASPSAASDCVSPTSRLLNRGEPSLASSARGARPSRNRACRHSRSERRRARDQARDCIALRESAPQSLDPDEAARQLATALPDVDVADLARRMTIGSKLHLAAAQSDAASTVAGQPARHSGPVFPARGSAGLSAGRALAHVLGFTDVDNHGIAGIEKSFDDELCAAPGAAVALDRPAAPAHPA